MPDNNTNNTLSTALQRSRQSYSQFLKGKRVAIVGPAPSILGSKQAQSLEAFDVIVRLNKALPVPKELQGDVGQRTDVLYNCMNPSEECGGKINIDLLHQQKVQFLVSPYAPYKSYRFQKDIKTFGATNLKHNPPIPFCHMDPKYFGRLMEIIKLPNTGISAILDLLQHDIAHLYITGFTFFKGGYVKQYRGYNEAQVLARMAKYNLHDQDRQLHYMQSILRDNPRVAMDNALSKLIESKKKVNFKVDQRIVRAPSQTSSKSLQLKITENNLNEKKRTKPVIKPAAKPVIKPVIKATISPVGNKAKSRMVVLNTTSTGPVTPRKSLSKKVTIKKPKISSGRRTIGTPKVLSKGRRQTLK